MLKIERPLKLSKLVRAPNIAKLLSERDRDNIGWLCKEGYETDLRSREQWERQYANSLKLAMQVMEAKSFPWPGASNVKFPLLTIAALNWHAKAYPAIVSPTGVVRARVLSPQNDPDGKRFAAATRVSQHMSYQLLEDSPWEEQTDRELSALPILGTMFRKTYYNAAQTANVSDLVFPKDLVVDYYTKSLETAARISHIIPITPNTLYEREALGHWVKNDYSQPAVFGTDGPIKVAEDKAHGLTSPITRLDNVPYEFIEQSCLLDLDGDGYAEPYYVTFEAVSGKVALIWARYSSSSITYTKADQTRVGQIVGQCCFTKISFIPSMDGSFYDIGFGMLLGPINHSVDSLLNMLIDSGVMSNLGGGFLGRGVKIKGGNYTFKPQEWKRVESSGEDLNKSVYPLPVRSPEKVLFDLLTYLVGYGERIAGSNDVQMGDLPGDNAKTGALQIANENGRAIFSATFKRVWRGHKNEFKKLFDLNATYFDKINQSYQVRASGEWTKVQREDYEFAASGVIPAADPNAVSQTERLQRANVVYNMAKTTPGHNMYEATKRVYSEMGVEGIDQILPDPKGPNAIPAAPDTKLMEAQAKQMDAETRRLDVQLRAQAAIGKLQSEEQLIRAKVIQLLADAELKMSQSDATNKQAILDEIHAQVAVHKIKLDAIALAMEAVKGVTDGQATTGGTGTKVTKGTTGAQLSTMADRPDNGDVLRLPSPGAPSPNATMG